MVIQGHIQNGVVIPGETLALPNGTEVTILVRTNSNAAKAPAANGCMDYEKRARYLSALEKIDAVPNENPGDSFSGADHDQALYGNEA